jgi:hypothetical protein
MRHCGRFRDDARPSRRSDPRELAGNLDTAGHTECDIAKKDQIQLNNWIAMGERLLPFLSPG